MSVTSGTIIIHKAAMSDGIIHPNWSPGKTNWNRPDDCSGKPMWLEIIHRVNDRREGTFGEPLSMRSDVESHYKYEEYECGRVIHPAAKYEYADAFVRIVCIDGEKRDRTGAVAALSEVAADLGLFFVAGQF